jgi:hypothetical protein
MCVISRPTGALVRLHQQPVAWTEVRIRTGWATDTLIALFHKKR